jgi:hypothetical protein
MLLIVHQTTDVIVHMSVKELVFMLFLPNFSLHLTDRGQVMTAGPPVMLRAPIQCVRQQLMMPPVDQPNSLSSSFSSIHQALIGTIRPHIELPPQPPGAPFSATVSSHGMTLQVQPQGNQQQMAAVQEAGNVLPKTVSSAETVQTTHDDKQVSSNATVTEKGMAAAESDTLGQNPGAQSVKTNAESESRDGPSLHTEIAITDVAEDSQETAAAVNGLLNEVGADVPDTVTNKVYDTDVTLAKNDVQNCVNGNGRLVSSKSDTRCSEVNVTLSNGEIKRSSSLSEIADNNGVMNAPAGSNKELIAPILMNGHKTNLPNGNCSPVPSCNSDDPDSACDVKCPVSDRDSETFLTNGVLEHDDDADDNDVGPVDCGDVLCKAMIRADIIDEGGRPAAVEGDPDDDSEMSTDLISGFLGSSAGETVGTNTSAGFDEEAASAVAGLLNEDVGSDALTDSDSSKAVRPARFAESEASAGESKIAEANVLGGSAPTLPECASRPDVSLPINVQVPVTCLQSNAVQHALPVNSSQVPQTHFVIARAPFPFAMPGAVAAVQNQSGGCVVQQDKTVGPQVAVASGQLANGTPSIGDATVPCPAEASTTAVPPPAPMPNGLVFSPQCSIALPSGQVVPAGVRLLIRPSGSTAAPYVGGAPPVSVVSWSHPGLSATSQSSLGSGNSVAAVGQPVMPLMAPGALQNNAGQPPVAPPPSSVQSVQLVSTASAVNTQNQLIIQRAQLLAPSTTPQMFQRLLLPRPMAVARPDSQVIMHQQQQQQTCQSAGVRPLITTQAALGQLRLTAVAPGHSSVQVSACPNQPGVAGGQQLLLNHQMLNMQGQRPASSPNQSASGISDVQSAVGSDDQSASNQAPYLVRPQQPSQAVHALFSPQHPVRLLGNAVQLRSGLVQAGIPGSNPVIIQQGGRQIVLQPPVATTNQQPPSYVMFRPGTPAIIAPRPVSASEPGKDPVDSDASTNSSQMLIGSSTTVTPIGSTFDSSINSSRKRPSTSSVGSRSLRKRKKGEEDDADINDVSSLPVVGYLPQSTTLVFMCEWSGCQK